MNLSHDALRDRTALDELKWTGGIFHRSFLQPELHVINDYRRVDDDIYSLEGLRIVLRVYRMGALTEDEQTSTARSQKYSKRATACMLLDLQRLLGHQRLENGNNLER